MSPSSSASPSSFNTTTFAQLKQHLQSQTPNSEPPILPSAETLHWACLPTSLRLLVEQSLLTTLSPSPSPSPSASAVKVLDLNAGADALGMTDLKHRLLYDLQVFAQSRGRVGKIQKYLVFHLPVELLYGDESRWANEGAGVLASLIKQAQRSDLTVHVHWHGALNDVSLRQPMLSQARTETTSTSSPLWQQVFQRWQQKRWVQLIKQSTQLGHVVYHTSVKHALRRLGVAPQQIVLQPLTLQWETLNNAPALIQPKAQWFHLYERLRAWHHHPNRMTFGVLGPIAPQSKALHTLCQCLAELPERFKLLLLADADNSPEEQSLRHLIQRLGLEQRVQWVGLPHRDSLRVVLPWIDTALVLPWIDTALVLPFDATYISTQSVQDWWQHTSPFIRYGWLGKPFELQEDALLTSPPQHPFDETTQDVVQWMQQHRQRLEQTLNGVQDQHWNTLHTLSAVAILLLERQQNEAPPSVKTTMTDLLQLASMV